GLPGLGRAGVTRGLRLPVAAALRARRAGGAVVLVDLPRAGAAGHGAAARPVRRLAPARGGRLGRRAPAGRGAPGVAPGTRRAGRAPLPPPGALAASHPAVPPGAPGARGQG